MPSDNFLDQYFSIFALFVVFRETIEASIIVGVLLQFLARTFPHLRRQVWWGVTAGLGLSIVFGIIFSIVFYVVKSNLFSGNNKNIFKGSIAWTAGILITWLAFVMLRYKGWEDKIKRKMETRALKELEKQKRKEMGDLEDQEPPTRLGRMKKNTSRACGAFWAPFGRGCIACMDSTEKAVVVSGRAVTCGKCCSGEEVKSELAADAEKVTGAKENWGIFLVVFTTVLREGIESVVFLAGVGNAAPSSLPLPGLVGFICGLIVGMFMYYSGKTVKDMKWFLISMSVVLFFIAGGQFMLGSDFLYQGGMFGYCAPFIIDRPWYMKPLWDFSACCPDVDTAGSAGRFFALVRAIFGYQDKPTMIEITVYFGFWFIVFCVAVYKWRTGSLCDADYKHKRQMAKEAKEREQAEASGLAVITDGSDIDQIELQKKLQLADASGNARSSSEEEASSSDDGKRSSAEAEPVVAVGMVPPQQQHLQSRQ